LGKASSSASLRVTLYGVFTIGILIEERGRKKGEGGRKKGKKEKK